MNALLNKHSGLLGVSGLSNDMRTLLEAEAEGNARARLAVDVFCYRLKKYIARLRGRAGRRGRRSPSRAASARTRPPSGARTLAGLEAWASRLDAGAQRRRPRRGGGDLAAGARARASSWSPPTRSC